MPFKLLSILGILVAVVCLWVATRFYPGGYDWNRDYLSTMLRGPAGPSRMLADAGAIFFCVSIALVFERLSRLAEFTRNSKVIRIAGIGSMVYSALAMTPMHDLMVTISIVFFLVAAISLSQALYVVGEIGFFVGGCACTLLLIATATIYYTGQYVSVLPWAQRATYALFAVWLVALDFGFPRIHLQGSERA